MYYAVRQGWFRGVFVDKKIASRATTGHPNPKMQEFFSRYMADGYVYQHNEAPLVVYTDGSYRHKYRRAGYGVFFGSCDQRNTFGSVPRCQRLTSQTAEAYAALIALGTTSGDVEIRTDCLQLVYCATARCHKYTPLHRAIRLLSHKRRVVWTYIKAHAGYHGNENADILAKCGSHPVCYGLPYQDRTYRDAVID